MKSSSATFNNIAGSLLRGDVGLLFGAGMSAGRIHLGSELAKRMLRRAVYGEGAEETPDVTIDALATRYPFEAVSDYLIKSLQYKNITPWLLNEGGFASATPSSAHRKLHEVYALLPHRFPKVVFTTNFDTLIEDEFGPEAAIGVTTSNLVDLHTAKQNGKIAVAHLHGSIRYPDSIIYGELPQATVGGSMFDLLRGALATDIFVLIGYSLADTNLREAFFDIQRVADTRRGLKKTTYAVSPEDGDPTDPSSPAGVAHEIWALRGVEHLCLSAEEFFAGLFVAIEKYRTVKMKEAVARALGKPVATLESMLRSAAEPFANITDLDLLIYLFYTLPPEKKD